MSKNTQLEASKSLLERLQRHPKLLARFEQMLDLVESEGQEVIKADDAELRVGENLQQLGQETLMAWA